MIPAEEVHPQLWVGANKKFRKVPRARLEKMKHERVSSRFQLIEGLSVDIASKDGLEIDVVWFGDG